MEMARVSDIGQSAMSKSWVVRDIATGRVVMETFNGDLRNSLDARYEMIPIREYLASLNRPPSQAD